MKIQASVAASFVFTFVIGLSFGPPPCACLPLPVLACMGHDDTSTGSSTSATTTTTTTSTRRTSSSITDGAPLEDVEKENGGKLVPKLVTIAAAVAGVVQLLSFLA